MFHQHLRGGVLAVELKNKKSVVGAEEVGWVWWVGRPSSTDTNPSTRVGEDRAHLSLL